MTSWRIGVSILGLFAVTLFLGCETHERDTRRHTPPSAPQTTGAPAHNAQGTMEQRTTPPMEQDRGGDRMIK